MQFISDWCCPTIIEIVGLIFLFYWLIYRPLKLKLVWLFNLCLSGPTSKRILKPNPGDFAVITGATDGIGLEYAKQLADKGFNLLLLSRTEDKLKHVSEDIQNMHPQCRNVIH